MAGLELVAVPVSGAVRAAAERLRRAGCDAPRLDAELLLAEVLELDRAGLVLQAARELSDEEAARFSALVARREAREPLAYVLGRRPFRFIELAVDPRVLIPRPETELLVEVALDLPRGSSVMDVGCGSGAVALALACERPDLAVRGVDVSADAVAVSLANARRLGLAVEFSVADLLPEEVEADAVLANLPYVPVGERDSLAAEITRYEPPLALFAGEDGLQLIRRLVAALPDKVGFVALEIGHDQAEGVCELLSGRGFSVRTEQDLAGHERVVVGCR